jgi:hypothetical protein
MPEHETVASFTRTCNLQETELYTMKRAGDTHAGSMKVNQCRVKKHSSKQHEEYIKT